MWVALPLRHQPMCGGFLNKSIKNHNFVISVRSARKAYANLSWSGYYQDYYPDVLPLTQITTVTQPLTHWGRVTHICVSKLTIIGSDNGLSPGRRQAIIWTNGGMLLIWPLGTNFSEIAIDINTFSFKKIHFKLSSGKWRPLGLGIKCKQVTDMLR